MTKPVAGQRRRWQWPWQRQDGWDDVVSGLAVASVAAWVLAVSSRMPYRRVIWDGPGLAPMLFGGLVLALALAVAGSGAARLFRSTPGSGARQPGSRGVAGGQWLALAGVAAYVLAVAYGVSFYAASLVFLAVVFAGPARMRWPLAAGASALTMAAVYGAFTWLFKVNLR